MFLICFQGSIIVKHNEKQHVFGGKGTEVLAVASPCLGRVA